MNSTKLYDNIDFDDFEIRPIKESNGSTDDIGALPNNVLAVVRGPAFVPNGYSRNGRFYPKELWENVINDEKTKSALDRKLMFGCIGHPTGEYTLDQLLESGKVSHIVTSIEIKNNMGIAEYNILNTPSGRILNAVISAGSRLYVSTRGFGGYAQGVKKHNGMTYKILDKNNFAIESIDFVISPGFLEADPSLTESLKGDLLELADDKAKIRCDEGICDLATKVVEDSKKSNNDNTNNEFIDESKSSLESKTESENDANGANDANDANDVFNDLNSLNKDSLIEMIKNISNENNQLIENITTINTYNKLNKDAETGNSQDNDTTPVDDVESTLVKKRIFISYIELIYNLIKNDTNYEKERYVLSGVLDKDNTLTQELVTKVKQAANDLLSKSVFDSVKILATKIANIDINLEVIKGANVKSEAITSPIFFDALGSIDETIEAALSIIHENTKKDATKDATISKLLENMQTISEKSHNNEKLVAAHKETILSLSEKIIEQKEIMQDKLSQNEQMILDEKSNTQRLEGLLRDKNNKTKIIENDLNDKVTRLESDVKEASLLLADEKNNLNMVSIELSEVKDKNDKLIDEVEKNKKLSEDYANEIESYKKEVTKLLVKNYSLRFPKLDEDFILSTIEKFDEDDKRINAFKSKEKRTVSIYESNTRVGVVGDDVKIIAKEAKESTKSTFLKSLL